MDQKTGTDKCDVTYEWNDEKCVEIANKHYFPSSVRNIDVQKGVITSFLNFYLGGRRQPGLDVSDLVFAVLSIIPATPKIDDTIWKETEYKVDGTLFFLTPEKKLKAMDSIKTQQSTSNPILQDEINEDTKKKIIPNEKETFIDEANSSSKFERVKMESETPPSNPNDKNAEEIGNNDVINHEDQDSKSKTATYETKCDSRSTYEYRPKEFPTTIEWFNSTTNTKSSNTLLEYGPVTNAAFNNSVTAMLDRWSQPSGTARATLKYFFAVIALVLLRATAKGYKHLEYAFSNDKFLTLISFCENEIQFSPPHKRCLKSAYRTFMRRDKNTPVIFAKIINLYESLHPKHKLKLTIKNALLSHTAGYGFNLVNLWRTITYHSPTPKHAEVIAGLSCITDTQASWCRLNDFINNYTRKRQRTFYWARVLNSEYFKDLSCQMNHKLAVILAVFVEKMTGNEGIWMSTWVNHGDLDGAKEVGCTIFEIYANMNL